jgi:hypothetical protein
VGFTVSVYCDSALPASTPASKPKCTAARRTLDDLYLVCEGDSQSELVQSTLRILEETVDDFRLLASTSGHDSMPVHSSRCSSCPESVADSCSSGQEAAPPADASAHISRSSGVCSASYCSHAWCPEGTNSTLLGSGWVKPQTSSRLSRSSSAGGNLQGLVGRSPTDAGNTRSSCSCSSSGTLGSVPQHTDIPPEIYVRADATQQASSSCSMPVAHACLVTDSLHDKLSSPDRCGSEHY